MVARQEAVNNSRITLGYYATVVCCGRVVGDSALRLLYQPQYRPNRAYADLLIRNRVPRPIELYQLIHGNSQAARSSPARPPVAFTLSRGMLAARVVLAGIPSRIVARTNLHDNGARGYLLAAITSSGGAVISSRAQRRDETLDISTQLQPRSHR